MLFNSYEFLIFFPVVTFLFFLLPHRFSWQWLLTASCFFYMFFKPEYLLILFFTIIVDYYAGMLIEMAKTERQKYSFLLLSLVANIGVLAVFKYYNFINDNISGLCSLLGFTNNIPYLHMLLPIGLSFHTFQAMSYTIEVYRGNQRAEKHFGIYALYVMFYPQLVAGPIERPQNLLHQFYARHSFKYENVSLGLKLMLLGMVKKVVIADRLSLLVDPVYAKPHDYPAITLFVASFFYAFQVLCDFSGYSDIAIGAAKVMGFDLMTNFNNPFISKNFGEFWRRWHISLSTWFNDYLFKPIVVAKRDWGNIAVVFGIMVTFLISGLWHGAGWTFVIFGGLHGLALTYEFITRRWRLKMAKNIPKIIYNNLSRLITFTLLVLTFIFFRAPTIAEAVYICGRLGAAVKDALHFLKTGDIWLGLNKVPPYYFSGLDIYLSLILIIIVIAGIFIEAKYTTLVEFISRQSKGVRWVIYYSLFISLLIFRAESGRQFIYFQF